MGVFETTILGEGEAVGVSNCTIQKSDGGIHCDHCAISNHSAAICRRMLRSNQQETGHFGAKYGEGTYRQTDHGTVTSITIREIACCQWCHLKTQSYNTTLPEA